MAKNKLNVKKILCAILFMAMGGLLIGSYFIPVLISTETITGLSSGVSCANVIADGSNDGVYTTFAVLGLINMILGCLMILGALIGLFAKVKNLDLLMIVLAVIITLIAIVMLILAITKLGTTYTIETTLGFGAFAFLIAGVLSLLTALFAKSKL